ncbi:MAG: hypothetical protein LBE13_21880 [Bacteroidales bacterium]|nr:hypothetical protein [Bacteroidales bacterium]
MDFSNYYKKKLTIHNIARQQIASHRFDINGEIIPIINNYSFIRKIRKFILRLIPVFLLRYYRRLRVKSNPDLYLCGKRGLTICGVFQKT